VICSLMDGIIAVVDDEEDILELVSIHLKKAGFKVEGFLEAKDFLKFLLNKRVDLIILDLMLPDADGIEICRYLKSEERFRSIPIIMLTARVTESDKILGFEIGADDYVTKPFSPRELVARVRAVLRRRMEDGDIIKVGDMLVIDPRRYEVYLKGKKIELTPTEFKILELLASRKGWVFTREQILEHLWGGDKIVGDRTVDVHIKNIREKLREASRFIKNIRGVGYKIEE